MNLNQLNKSLCTEPPIADRKYYFVCFGGSICGEENLHWSIGARIGLMYQDDKITKDIWYNRRISDGS